MAQENTNATEGYQMKTGWGTIAMLISATGMGLVPLFSRWATRTDMFDGTMGLNAGDSIGALMACGRMGMGVLFFVILMVATHKVKTFKELKLTPAIALGGLMIGMSLACYVTSTLLTTVANAVLFIYTGPVICVLAARIFRKEPMSGLQWICLLVVFIGLRMWGVPILRQLSPVPAKPCRFKGKALAVGLLTGLMPCGALSSMWMFAASSGSWKSGAAAMLAFGLGTCVFMLAFGLFGVFIPKKYNKYLVKCSTVLIVTLGLILMTKGIKILL